MLVSGLGCWDIGLVTPALDFSFWSWAFGPASFLISNCDCLWTCMLEQNACLSSIWLVIPKLYSAYHFMIVSGLACWDIRLVTPACGLVVWKMGLRPSCILNIELWLFLDLHVTTFDVSLQHRSRHFDCFWICHVCYRLHRLMTVSGFACWDIEFVTAALDLSFCSWACVPASFLISNQYWLWACILG